MKVFILIIMAVSFSACATMTNEQLNNKPKKEFVDKKKDKAAS
jgi:hypothetical protein